MTAISPSPASIMPVEDLYYRIADEINGDCTCHVSVRLDGCIEEEPLRFALSALQQRHPKLRARITTSEKNERFYEACEPVPPVPVEILDSDRQLPVLIEDPLHYYNGVLNSHATPLMRVRVFRNREQGASILTVTIPHALGGAASQALLVTDLLAYYAAVKRAGGPLEVPSLPMVTEVRAARMGTFRNRLGLLANRIRYELAFRRGFLDLPRADPLSHLPFCHRWSFSAGDSMALVRRCRQQDTSIFGALLAASLLGLKASSPPSSIRVAWQCPVDISDQLGEASARPTADGLGVYGVLFQELYTVDESSSFWALARRARRDMKAFLARGGGLFLYRLINRVFRRRLRSQKARPESRYKRATLQVSYLGFLGGSKAGEELRILDWLLAVNSTRVGPSIMVGAYMLGNQLHFFVFGFDLDRDFWDGYLHHMRRRLQQATDEAPEAP